MIRFLLLVLGACASSVSFREVSYEVSNDEASRFASLLTDYRASQQDLATRAQAMEAVCTRGEAIENVALRVAFVSDCRTRAGATSTAISQRDAQIAEKQRQEQAARDEAERQQRELQARTEARMQAVLDVIASGDFTAAAALVAAVEREGHDVSTLTAALAAARKTAADKLLAQAETALENGDFVRVDALVAQMVPLGHPPEAELLDRVRVAKAADCANLRARATTAALSLAASRAWLDALTAVHSDECDASFAKPKQKVVAASVARAKRARKAKKSEAFDAELALLRAAGAQEAIEKLTP